MSDNVTKGSRGIKISLKEEEVDALKLFYGKYFTTKNSTIIRNLVRDEMKIFEEKNKNGIFVNYQEQEEKNTIDIIVYFDTYTYEFIRKFATRLDVPANWFVKFLIGPQIRSVQEKEKL